MCLFRTIGPKDASVNCLLKLLLLDGKLSAFIEAHYDINTQPVLNICRNFGVQIYFCTVYMAGEFNAVIINFSQ